MTDLDIYSKQQTDALVSTKQDELESGVNIKTINGNSLLGSGDMSIGSGVTIVDKQTYYTIVY